ncbi:MAG: Eco57I restriction-modification methylase domain-containing protein [Candidatus Eisenbacteria bacterium]
MSARTDLPSVLTRALLAAASPRIGEASAPGPSRDLFPRSSVPDAGSFDLAHLSTQSHRLLADLITLLLLELEGLVTSPLNSRARARLRLGAPSRSRVLAEWRSPLEPEAPASLFEPPDPGESPAGFDPTIARDPEAFYRRLLLATRETAASLSLAPSAVEEMIRWLLPIIARCDPEDDPVGWIHAHEQRHALVRGPGNRLRFQVDRDRGRSHGVLYTPPPLTEALVESMLHHWACGGNGGERPAAGLFDQASADLSGGAAGAAGPTGPAGPAGPTGPAGPAASEARPAGLPPPPGPIPTILDPSCGSGQFLLSLARRLLAGRSARPEEMLAVFQSMHGVDIDLRAASLAALNLSLQAVRALSRSQGVEGRVVAQWLGERLGPGFPWFLGTQIHRGNALLLARTIDGDRFLWTERFASIFTGERPGFDLVVGNPPWVSYGLRDREGVEEEESAYLRRLYTFGAQYKLSLYPLFIELALRLTRPGGLHGFLVPDSFFTGKHFSRIREHILETCRPLLFCLVESGPWPGVHVGHTAYYCVRRLPAPGAARPVMTRVLKLGPPNRRAAKRTGAGTLSLFSSSGEDRERPVLVDVDHLRKTPYTAFRIYRDEAERQFVEDLERTPLRFEDVIETYSGLIARYGQESVTGLRKGEFVLRDRAGRLILSDPDPSGRWRPALRSGSEVEPFRTRWRGGMLYVPDDHETLRKVYKSGFDLERYAADKVLLRQTGDRLVAARDDTGLLCLNNVHILGSRGSPPIDPRFLCGLLMSEPMERYYQIIALEAGRPLAQVDLVTVQSLPYPADPSGAPYGAVPRSGGKGSRGGAKVAARVEELLRAGKADGVIALLERSLGGSGAGVGGAGAVGDGAGEAGGATSSSAAGSGGSSDAKARDEATILVATIVTFLETAEEPAARKTGTDALDGSIRLLFRVPQANSSGARAARPSA